MLNLTQKNKLLDILIPLLAFVLFFEILFSNQNVLNWLSNLVESIGVFGWIAIGILQFVQVVLIPIPAYFITLTSMKMYPNDLGWLYVMTLSVVMLGVVVAYLIGRKWGKKAVIWVAGSEEEYLKWSRFFNNKKANLLYLGTVILPVFPDDVLCFFAGSIKMNFLWFTLCNLFGRALGLVTFMFVFTKVSNSIVNIIVFSVLLVLAVVLKIIIKRKLKNESNIDRE